MDERNNHFDFDFTPIGQAIKKAREARGMTREQLSGIIGYVQFPHNLSIKTAPLPHPKFLSSIVPAVFSLASPIPTASFNSY